MRRIIPSKNTDGATLDRVREEMALPRATKSVRMKTAKHNKQRQDVPVRRSPCSGFH